MKRLLRWTGAALALTAVVIGGEAWLAFRRDYLPTDRPLDIRGSYGPDGAPAMRIAILGDSTAAGIGVETADDSYPVLVSRRLALATGRQVELRSLGVAGARVADIAASQVPEALEWEPDVVLIAAGANDVTHLTPLGDVRDSLREALEPLLEAGIVVVVAGPPDMRVYAWLEPLRTLSYLRGRQVEDAMAEVAHAAGVPVVALREETGSFFAADPEGHFSEDRFHPGPLGYRRWADAIAPVLIEAVADGLDGTP